MDERDSGQKKALDEFFKGREESRRIFDVLQAAISHLGNINIRVTKSQVAFYRHQAFAWAWTPERYLRRKAAPLVLTLSFHYREPSQRWKEVVEPSPGRFTHHLELYSIDDVDDQVQSWLQEAWDAAG